MTKFGELISVEKPVLLDFYKNWEDAERNVSVLRNIVKVLGNKAKVIKIDISKNELLADALGIKVNPTFMIYKQGEMKWRETGYLDESTLLNMVQQFI
ncbi:thioredoxin domain-containing protein [uncultured Polaribacter sp.]|uniref:thioredoxin family protein n=1 Tax=uncultured Polaribacter sp. TaxID=174711 RepID=UPI0026061982|nr:thioredoxin domain-containing protein [uncultured Polaribacter sp.]